jgi:hypothetical protein
MVLDAALAENWIDAIVLADEQVVQLFLLLVLFDFHRDHFLAVLVDEAAEREN